MLHLDPSTREIRVFLSSTFRDMEVIRDHLLKEVFPRIRAACQERRVGFTEIYLRWGITEEAAKNGATVEICLEIDRCRDFPSFFIGFLGERYGWIPRHDELNAYWGDLEDNDYERCILEAVQASISVTELEMELAVLKEGAVDKLHSHALFMLRDKALTGTQCQQDTGREHDNSDPGYYDQGGGKLEQLKARVSRILCKRVFSTAAASGLRTG